MNSTRKKKSDLLNNSKYSKVVTKNQEEADFRKRLTDLTEYLCQVSWQIDFVMVLLVCTIGDLNK